MSSPSFQWPPDISESELETLTLLATTYALSHGLVYLPVAEVQPSAPTSTIHAPLALFPSPIPRKQFEKARSLQSIYNVLYSRIATDIEFLDRVMGEEQGVGQVDDFTGQLWRQWKRLRDREGGIVQVRVNVCHLLGVIQKQTDIATSPWTISLGLHVACARRIQFCVPETSRVQHHILFIWDVISAECSDA